MSEAYNGWNLMDEVIIVSRGRQTYGDDKQLHLDTQGYIVDPKNKNQLSSALQWGEWTEYGPYDYDNRCYEWKKEHEAEQETFVNDNFTLELCESANGSSQGGKLSFWNCKITAPNGNQYVVGIAADLLLDVLKHNTFINGVCQSPLMFARCKGGVGMLSKNMPAYQSAINDMQRKKDMSKGKTSKHIPGHTYVTTTLNDVYLGDIYSWYEPVYKEEGFGWYGHRNKLVAFKRREKPLTIHIFTNYHEDKPKLSDYVNGYIGMTIDKLPRRREGENTVELDITLEEYVNRQNERNIFSLLKSKRENPKSNCWINTDMIGISASDKEYTMPADVVDAILELGYTIIGA